MKALNSEVSREWGLAVVRIVVGLVFFMHGWQKLFVFGFAGVAAFFEQLGIPLPMVAGVVVTLVELVGGTALILGLFTRWAAIPLAINMLVALVTVHLAAGFFMPNGYEFVLTLLAANVGLLLAGSGAFSVDAWLASRKSQPVSAKTNPATA